MGILEEDNEIMVNIDELANLISERLSLMALVASLREENDRLRYILKGGPR